MSVTSPSDGVSEIMRSAAGRVLIVAPYIKKRAIEKLVSEISPDVSDFICVTRWLPEDIASGVCDLEIMEIVESQPHGQLMINPHLHAKYYRAGKRCLVGSANITHRGLGWVTPSNIELLIEVASDVEGLSEWENALLSTAIPATPEIRDQIKREAERLKEIKKFQPLPEIEDNSVVSIPFAEWLPTCSVPEGLWTVYMGEGADQMAQNTYDAAKADLAALAPPSNLSQTLFHTYIASILKQMPLVVKFDSLASKGITESIALSFLSEQLVDYSDDELKRKWEIVKMWLMHFFPDSYRLEPQQEVLVKGRKLEL